MIVFENPGELDIRAAITFGVNVKETENPIGYFGTGLKYALAVLLRASHKVTINSGSGTYTFAIQRDLIRGKEFGIVTMSDNGGDPMQLGFTDNLGPTWEVWMAYRELWCNARDENGQAYKIESLGQATDQMPGITQIIVEGLEIDHAHNCRADFILDGEEPAHRIGTVEVYRGRPRGIFYRGMRVAKQIGDKPLKFTYNILGNIALTEDRTAKSQWELEYELTRAILTEANEELASEIVCAGENGEGKFDFKSNGFPPGHGFMEAVKNCSRAEIGNVNATAVQVFKARAAKNPDLVPAKLGERESRMLQDAMTFCQRIGFKPSKYPIQIIEGLGENILGVAQGGRILISTECFARGAQWVRMALIEEFVHLEYNVSDCTREMQTRFLMEIERIGNIAVPEMVMA